MIFLFDGENFILSFLKLEFSPRRYKADKETRSISKTDNLKMTRSSIC